MTNIPERCVERHQKPKFVVEEKRSAVKFENPNRCKVEQIKIDGCVFGEGDGERCDSMVTVPVNEQSILIELKGSDIKKAISQLQTTHKALITGAKTNTVWIVAYSGSPSIRPEIQNLIRNTEKQHKATILVKRSGYVHQI